MIEHALQDSGLEETKRELLASLLLFTRVFYKLTNGREFNIVPPFGRESHYITICRALHRVFRGEIKRLIINIPPRYGKTECVIHFIAFCLAHFPDSNFLYVSYAHTLAKKQTQIVKQILQLPYFRKLFNVHLSQATSAKDNFETTAGGSVYAAGSGGTITGRGAGIMGINRFGGAVIIDDVHKPDEVTSDTIREGIKTWYSNTLMSRVNNPETPIILIGQCLHEDDLTVYLREQGDWEVVKLCALDEAGNALDPTKHTAAQLLRIKELTPYVFASQYQQDPQPAGGGIFKTEWFYQTDIEPDIEATFITADTAETDKDYNDATVFSFWGIYRIKHGAVDTGMYALHWIDCLELRIEPKDLEAEYLDFYASCMRHSIKPKFAAIEKKSTGVTLLSTLGRLQGLRVIDIERNRSSGNKASRFLDAQAFVANKQISFTKNAKHVNMCIEHCGKITANNTHRHDDIADTMYDAIKLALIDKMLIPRDEVKQKDQVIAQAIMSNFQKEMRIKAARIW